MIFAARLAVVRAAATASRCFQHAGHFPTVRILSSTRSFTTNYGKSLCTANNSQKEKTSYETDYSHQYGWNTFAAMIMGVGVATAIGVYSKWHSGKSADKTAKSGDHKESSPGTPKWSEEAKLLEKLPDRVPFLIIGAGTAAFSAARSIRSREPTAKVLLIGEEPFLPYMRPPLSKELWLTPTAANDGQVEQPAFMQWSGRARSVYLERSQFFSDIEDLPQKENGGIAVARSLRVVALNPRRQTVVVMPASASVDSDAPRREVSYDRCLIATGGKPRVLPQFEGFLLSGKVSLFRNLQDYTKLTATADRLIERAGSEGKPPAVVVVGGGFLGCELAFALAWRAKQSGRPYDVYQIIRERGVLDQVLPAYLSSWTADRLTEAGVKLVSGVNVSNVEDGKDLKLKLSNGEAISAAHVVLATGIEPNTDLAEEAGLEVDAVIGGIAVNSELLARNNIWAAGDVSSFYDPRLRSRRRVEHHDQAIVSGRLAGENMAGASKVYSQQAMFWSDLGPSVSFEAVGLVDSHLQTYAVFAQPKASKQGNSAEAPEDFKRGVIFYLSTPNQNRGDDSRRLVGILLWNLPGRVGLARRLLKDQPRLPELDGGAEKLTEIARMMQINDDDSELNLPPGDKDEDEGSASGHGDDSNATPTQPESKP